MTEQTDTPPLSLRRRDGVLIMTIERPQVRNAIDLATAELIAAALDELDATPELRIGILTGAGGYFSAGMDLAAFARDGSPRVGDRGFAGITRRAAEKPLIAAVEGFALAGGFEIALACDLIVAARGARFGLPEARRSIVAAGGALLRLPKRMPYHAVMELALTGEPIVAERLEHFGVVNRLVEPGEALTEALGIAATIAANGPLALRATKQILEAQFDWPADRQWELQAQLSEPVLASEDAREGALAFKEKRSPVWHGR